MSLEDLRRVAGYRVVQDVRLTNSVLAVVEGRRAFKDCQRANDGLMNVIAGKDADIASLQEQRDGMLDRANKWQRKAQRRKPWLFFGLGAATLYVVQLRMK